jgi:hypothetical protein
VFVAVLHPGLKLEYFRQHEWDDEWIEIAENLVREEYAVNYQKKDDVSGNGNTEEQSDQVRYNLVTSMALINEQYRNVWTASSISLTFRSPHHHRGPLTWMCTCEARSRTSQTP